MIVVLFKVTCRWDSLEESLKAFEQVVVPGQVSAVPWKASSASTLAKISATRTY